MISVQNMGIGVKVFIAPVFAFFGIILLAVVGSQALREQGRALDQITTVAFVKSTDSMSLAAAIMASHMNLYRMLTWQAAGTDDAKVKEIKNEFVAQLNNIEKTVNTLKMNYAEQKADTSILAAMAKDFGEYHRNANNVLEMMDIEFSAAVTYMWVAQGYADKVLKLANDLEASGKVMVDTDYKAAAAEEVNAQNLFLGLAAGTLGLAGIVAWLIGRMISGPVRGMTAIMRKLAAGDLSVTVPEASRKDEVGAIAAAVQVFKDNAIETHRLTEEREAAHAAEAVRTRTIHTLTRNFDREVTEVLNVVSGAATELDATSQALSTNADHTNSQAIGAASAAEEAASSVQSAAAAAEELSSSIAEIARQVVQSNSISQKASEEARHTNDMVKGLAESAGKISRVVDLINAIASQTNLLALNATIEAARAGEAGRGFAVVANEVKSLAKQTASATEEISAQISAVQASTQDAVKAIGEIVTRISEINCIAATISSSVEEQSAATAEIARNVEYAASGTRDVSANVGGVSQAATETGSAAGQVLSTAHSLAQQSEHLKSVVSTFLVGVRSAQAA